MSTDNAEGESPHDTEEPTVRPHNRDHAAASDDEIAATPQLTDRGHPDDTDWRKHTNSAWVRVDGRLVGSDLDTADADIDHVKAHYEILPSRADEVCLSFEVAGDELEVGGNEHLTPTQAEGLAAALLEAADQARNGGADDVE